MRLLIIGDLNGQFGAASKIATNKGARVKQVNDIDLALELLRNGSGADLIMIDVKRDIKRLIDQMLAEHIYVPVVACGFDNNANDAVAAIQAGAKEYIPLPPNEQLIAAIIEAITQETTMVMGISPEVEKIYKLVNQVAPSDASILITGESGTGKEVFSRYIHQKSKRADKPFISVNCAAIPDNLLESELFGHEKGAFTGAIAKRIGKFEESNNGTLLLDEISEIDIKLQAKLLRAIQEREIDRVGGSKPIKLNIRIIATSNRDLKKEVAEGRFREDLYFRLNIINMQLPPLRQRKKDIIQIAEYFIKKYSKNNSLQVKKLSTAAKDLILKYEWPGNIRELENAFHRAVLLANDVEINEGDLMLYPADDYASNVITNHEISNNFIGRTVEDVERDLILSTLNHCLGNRTHAANILGISIRTLRNKLHTYSETAN
jgi:DNA-binding NtrC family response regulator